VVKLKKHNTETIDTFSVILVQHYIKFKDVSLSRLFTRLNLPWSSILSLVLLSVTLLVAVSRDYAPFTVIKVNNRLIGSMAFDSEVVKIHDLNITDTLSFRVQIDTVVPDDTYLLVIDSNSRSLRVDENEYSFNKLRWNGKSFPVAVSELQDKSMSVLDVFYSNSVQDSLGSAPHYLGRVLLY